MRRVVRTCAMGLQPYRVRGRAKFAGGTGWVLAGIKVRAIGGFYDEQFKVDAGTGCLAGQGADGIAIDAAGHGAGAVHVHERQRSHHHHRLHGF